MGIYNIVKDFELDCPVCQTKISSFQTKGGNGVLDVVSFISVNDFYAVCPNCHTFIEFYYEPDKTERTIEDYKMRIIRGGE